MSKTIARVASRSGSIILPTNQSLGLEDDGFKITGMFLLHDGEIVRVENFRNFDEILITVQNSAEEFKYYSVGGVHLVNSIDNLSTLAGSVIDKISDKGIYTDKGLATFSWEEGAPKKEVTLEVFDNIQVETVEI